MIFAKEYVPGKGKAASRKTRSDKSKPRCYSRATIRGHYRVLRTILTAATAADDGDEDDDVSATA